MLSHKRYEDEMAHREWERHEYKRQRKKARVAYPSEICDEPFHIRSPKALMQTLEDGEEEVLEDVKALMLPPSDVAKAYCSMYAYGKHVRVRSAVTHLTTTDSGVAATFRQFYCAGTKDTNLRAAELEYVG